ncbi:hypothetical protein, partial [Atlantibacter hermannii]|uniref:hypothetical protein n=1 Tax=Atlantibacter hermannii TaxID=565 RepID=UPI0028AF1130
STLKSPSYTKSVSWQHYPSLRSQILSKNECLINFIRLLSNLHAGTFNVSDVLTLNKTNLAIIKKS